MPRFPAATGNQSSSRTVLITVKLIEILKVALAAIWAHKLRSALTLLGMIVGVTAFVVVVSLIQGFNVYIDEKIAGIGANRFPFSASIRSKISKTRIRSPPHSVATKISRLKITIT
ncbi:MAG: hypothetical protein DMF70_08005 [Acidobacteria bacterium]|nr:MAG: hypothetical protein DMF70_08005 [Acidobacteriota bacterium]